MPAGFGGYTHWMAMTPYANSNDDLENPSILASNDGTTWVVPDGLVNPLDEVTGVPYNADVDLVLVSGTLYCFWRYWDGTTATVFYRTSTDGVSWGPKTTCLVGDAGETLRSPMIWHDGTTWHMWYGSGLYYRTATDVTGPWSARTACNALNNHGNLWHQAVFHDGVMWRAIFNNNNAPRDGGFNIALASSRDGLLWHTSTPVLNARPGQWDAQPYRATGRIEGAVLRMWYSALSDAGAWRIGYTEIPADLFPNPD